jgi:hypothetical protein
MSFRSLLAWLLVIIGLLSMLGHVSRQKIFFRLGMLTVASPLPLVFTDRRGMEDFANEYSLIYSTAESPLKEISLQSKELARLEGSFTRKAVFAAAIAYAPRLPRALWRAVLGYGFCHSGPLAQAIEEKSPLRSYKLVVRTLTKGRTDEWEFRGKCDKI